MSGSTARAAVFLDRDGVLIEDSHLITDPGQMRVLPGVPEALRRLKGAGFVLVVISNQTVVSRGLCSEDEVRALNGHLQDLLRQAGGAVVDAFYVCPHHPSASLPAYRRDCECRKPRPGMLLDAARDLSLDLVRSFMVGDRPSDVAAGRRAGCRAVLVQTGRHEDPPIETPEGVLAVEPDAVLPDLARAADWILSERGKP